MSETATLPAESDVPTPPSIPVEVPALRAIGLVRHYGRVKVVNGLDLEVPRGKIYGFLGRNGAGKTTTIRMLMGILKPTRGEIEFFGERTKRTTIPLKRRIGYVSQSQHFYPWMSARQLGRFVSGFYPTWDDAEYDRLLGLLDIPPDRRSSQLSGGMRMKLALALALAHHPDLLILDEPTAGLDPVAQREFLEIIKNQSRNHGRTTLFSTHRIDEVERAADKVGIIDGGMMRYEGPLDNLRADVRRVIEIPATESPTFPEIEAAASGDGDAVSLESPLAAPLPVTPLALPPARPENPFANRDDYELLRDESLPSQRRYIYRCLAENPWADAIPAGWETESLNLEDIFLAYAGMKVADL
ncbi:MAG: ABC transporter ATP-binding protein [Verrucomicrobiae bacterium]|nr:ABC transporter ATP-binding protein [Verrucomicrobiae bacterium]